MDKSSQRRTSRGVGIDKRIKDGRTAFWKLTSNILNNLEAIKEASDFAQHKRSYTYYCYNEDGLCGICVPK